MPCRRRFFLPEHSGNRAAQQLDHYRGLTSVYSRTIVGWHVAATMGTEALPLQAFEQAVWAAGADLTGLVHHSDRGSQRGFNWSTQHFAVAQIVGVRSRLRPEFAIEVACVAGY